MECKDDTSVNKSLSEKAIIVSIPNPIDANSDWDTESYCPYGHIGLQLIFNKNYISDQETIKIEKNLPPCTHTKWTK